MDSLPKPKDTYGVASLQKTEQATLNEIKNYGNNFGGIIKKHFDPIEKNEVEIMEEFLKNGYFEKTESLKKISLAYENTAEEAIKIKVPSEIADEHLNVLNYFYKISESLQNIQNMEADPVLGMLAIGQYQENATKARASLININMYFIKNQVTFSKNENGNIFALYNK